MEWTKIKDQILFKNSVNEELLELLQPFYSKVAICCKWEEIPFSIRYPFNSQNTIFAEPPLLLSYHETPPIWDLMYDFCDKHQITYACANHHSVTVHTDKFTQNYYKFENGEWYVKLHKDNHLKVTNKFKIF